MKILPCGVAIIEGDTHVSRWVEKNGTLCIAERMLAPFRKYIPEGGVVVDAGAMIGDHTVTYADWVGPEGSVRAFEPNPAAFECLEFNMKERKQVACYRLALSDADGQLSMMANVNAGASHLFDESGDVTAIPLDELKLDRLDFLKMDVEGFETRLLWGARDTIKKLRPVILSEVNAGALERAGSSRDKLWNVLKSLHYNVGITDPNILWDELQYDVICIPIERQ